VRLFINFVQERDVKHYRVQVIHFIHVLPSHYLVDVSFFVTTCSVHLQHVNEPPPPSSGGTNCTLHIDARYFVQPRGPPLCSVYLNRVYPETVDTLYTVKQYIQFIWTRVHKRFLFELQPANAVCVLAGSTDSRPMQSVYWPVQPTAGQCNPCTDRFNRQPANIICVLTGLTDS
jgi:hypothetical protein